MTCSCWPGSTRGARSSVSPSTCPGWPLRPRATPGWPAPITAGGSTSPTSLSWSAATSTAGKHTPPGSTVSVALAVASDAGAGTVAGARAVQDPGDTGAVQRGVLPSGPRVELSITDDGPGIPPELL